MISSLTLIISYMYGCDGVTFVELVYKVDAFFLLRQSVECHCY